MHVGIGKFDTASRNSGLFPPGAHVAASNQFGLAPIGPAATFQPGAAIAVASRAGDASRTDVFAIDLSGRPGWASVIGAGHWSGPSPM
jgi:hypothetical protein